MSFTSACATAACTRRSSGRFIEERGEELGGGSVAEPFDAGDDGAPALRPGGAAGGAVTVVDGIGPARDGAAEGRGDARGLDRDGVDDVGERDHPLTHEGGLPRDGVEEREKRVAPSAGVGDGARGDVIEGGGPEGGGDGVATVEGARGERDGDGVQSGDHER
ncbi:MAG: hypothetical protein R3A52_14395 [Polyangiales bacterium]